MSTENVVLMSKTGSEKRIVADKSREHALAIEGHLEERFRGTASECAAFKTNSEKFKIYHGHSKSMARNMRKHDLNPSAPDAIAEYKEIRKKRRKVQRAISNAKHDRALGGRDKSKTAKIKK